MKIINHFLTGEYHTEGLEIHIDGLSPCLTHRQSGEHYKTTFLPLERNDLSTQVTRERSWINFDWGQELHHPKREVYKLLVLGSEQIQGLISLEIDQGFIFVHLAESAPWNVGSDNKIFSGVGAHLFAIACKISFTRGFDGYVSFISKTSLIDHYKKELGAKDMGRGLYIDTPAALRLVNYYFNEEG
ncbi:hypothetical protein ABER99_20175 [Paenibacillus glucanolyticus]|jgi:hypothetical protein|uniref:GNAT family N-acetyltransferase n=1 Tax=Paenibacillus glucanolyticus TaxID=59843 RepID=A0A163GLC2_9BACL|nr:hypothetical protein [Paenibacillus glucanolyticus]KZS45032.1 hypothetical protein AWU65_03355 [Paenibacillus glucanolyticus]OMF66731.1 hypothetical protein BK142_29360 [Paenibacillus glucanolyticus]